MYTQQCVAYCIIGNFNTPLTTCDQWFNNYILSEMKAQIHAGYTQQGTAKKENQLSKIAATLTMSISLMVATWVRRSEDK